MGAKLLKRRQGCVGEDELCVHAAKRRMARLTDGSDETARTPKIVSDAQLAVRLEDEDLENDEAALWRPHRES